MQSHKEFFAAWQKLTRVEEETLAKNIPQLADRGFPPTREGVTEMGNLLLRTRLGHSFQPLGIHWIDRYLGRMCHTLGSKWSRPLDIIRAEYLTQEAVNDWFHNIVKTYVVDAGIEPQNIYGMDETGFQLGDHGRQRVIGRKNAKSQHKQTGGDHETITVLATICADGSYLNPSIIYKGTNVMKKWGERNVANAL